MKISIELEARDWQAVTVAMNSQLYFVRQKAQSSRHSSHFAMLDAKQVARYARITQLIKQGRKVGAK